jgi:signal transduction histidine kinase
VSTENVDARRGSGLGYLIIRDLLKFADAKIEVNSELNTGTTVEVWWKINKEK